MSLDDQHWCSNCGIFLDKRKDEYIEMNFNNWKGRHIQYQLIHKPTNKVKKKFKTDSEARIYLNGIPNSKLTDKDPENYEINVVAKKMKKVTPQHNRVFLCQKCYAEFLQDEVERLRKIGNPIFHCSVTCWSWKECTFYEAPDTPPIPHTTTPCEMVNAGEPEKYQEANCKHIAVIDDVVYCKRKHPGAVVLTIEHSIIQERRQREIPILANELMDKLYDTLASPKQIEVYLSAYPEGPLKKIKRQEYQAQMSVLQSALKELASKQIHDGSEYFMTKAGDHELYVKICEEKVFVDKKKSEQEEEGDDGCQTTSP